MRNYLKSTLTAFTSLLLTTGYAQTVTVTCTGVTGSYKSGAVTSSGVLTDGTITVTGSTATPASTVGWAVFDLTTVTIPTGATITGATITVNKPAAASGSGTPGAYSLTGTAGDLSNLATTAQGTTLYTSLSSGTGISTTAWQPTQSGTRTLTINTAGRNFLANNLTGPVTVGFTITSSSRVFTMEGYTGAVPPTLNITYAPPAPPCAGAPNPGGFGCSDDDNIDTFILVGENATAFYDYATGCVGTSAYDNRTAQPAVSLMQGTNYNAMVNSVFGSGDYAAVWIDFDNDNVFTYTERITAMTTDLDVFTKPVPINIPATASLGLRKMRVMVGYPNNNDATTFDACNSNSSTDGWDYGEVHDYTINIIANPLAITLENIAVKNAGTSNILSWNTASEERTDKFDIERSTDGGKNFVKIASKNANGIASNYIYTDKNPVQGNNYYRLKMMDAAGHVTYSKMVNAVVTTRGNIVIDVHPNPAKDVLNVKLYNVDGVKGELAIYDLTGKLMVKQNVTDTDVTVNLNEIHAGIYFLKYSDGITLHTLKFTKQ
ncbi:MAG TPA: GEVED domain-containing protein [Flavipsychrobacter sp.]|nr:GEVED domain-containing protein [Flavipsychrobacter sp.]